MDIRIDKAVFQGKETCDKLEPKRDRSVPDTMTALLLYSFPTDFTLTIVVT